MPIPAIPAIPVIGGATGIDPSIATGAATAAPAGSADAFSNTLLNVIDQTQAAQAKSSALGVQAATGDLRNVHDYMIAATEASTMLEMTVAIKNEAVRAFQSVMNTPV